MQQVLQREIRRGMKVLQGLTRVDYTNVDKPQRSA